MSTEDPEREDRITNEVVVDCYDETERALGWYYYLESKLSFPFKATCIIPRPGSPLRPGDEVTVTALAEEDECMHDMRVSVSFNNGSVTVPLRQLRCLSRKPKTREAVTDWHYWVFRGYEF